MNVSADVAVIGGGLGGCAAALAAAGRGLRVVLTEATDQVGGQVTSQLVSALDEHPDVETFPGTATYGAFRDAVRTASGGQLNPGEGWVSRLCFEPAVGRRVLETLLDQAGVRVLTGIASAAVTLTAGSLRKVTFTDGTVVEASLFCDATELGDLLPLAGAPWVTGSEGPVFGEEHALAQPDPLAMQACTWSFVVEHVPGATFEPVRRPGSYHRWADRFAFDVPGWDGRTHRFRMFVDGPDGRPPFWSYRRLSHDPDVALINWVSNDYADASLVHEPERARRESREQSLSFLHWLQTQAPHDDGSGAGFRSLRLAPAVAGTADGLAAFPYVRESRRLRTAGPVRGTDLAPVPGRARAKAMPDAVGVAQYHIDFHPRVGHPDTVYAATAPFQIPMRALIADRPVNLLAAAKNLAATQVAAAAYRVHSAEWSVGEAAGTLAAYCAARGLTPATVLDQPGHRLAVQRALVVGGAAIAWTTDIPPSDPLFPAAQLLTAAGGLAGERRERLEVCPEDLAGDRDRATLHAAGERLAAGPLRPPNVATATGRTTWRDLTAAYAEKLGLTHPGGTT
ncbi:FAD-dependent oxidoreductase [Kribbella italica]|uniref:FAD-dependent oxidoreductase n=1 Tax=Kribbella italica TaxID=1540520 RepID=A0A7W9J0A9_9ACTN|nr:FAD-dependent oxidoreductase [Kribbella italica]MBB5833302.1 hypothetical protein [Kribbella italica]